MNVVYATTRAALTLADGSSVLIEKGTHWPADDPAVIAQPSLFSEDPRWGLNYSREPDGYRDAPVEQATSAPGERRQIRRNS